MMTKGENSGFSGRKTRGRKRSIRPLFTASVIFAAAITLAPQISRADEGGVSFWLPGLFGSLAAAPAEPGWSVAAINYFTNVNAGANVAAARQIEIGRFSPTATASLSASLHADADLEFVSPTYVFGTPVFGGQASVSMGGIYGVSTANVAGTLTASVGPISKTVSESISGTAAGFGDLYPQATLKWNQGVNNYMIYGTGDIPVGSYDSTRLANLGIGHGAVDGGAGYTYFDPTTGHEFSAVAGFTYNLMNTSTDYQNGVDFHVDFAASQFLTKQLLVGVVGYVYDEVGCDSGSGDRVGCFQSRVVGLGPQIGYLFPFAGLQGYLNLKAYGEFANQNRPDGVNVWLTFQVSPAPEPPAARVVSK
jgi:hypothetical protein